MQVEFKVRVNDLRNATRHLTVNRGENKANDFADLLVSECIATLRTIGSSTELPVHGIQPGSARLPMLTLEKIAAVAKTFKGNETLVLIWDGLIKIGSWQTRNQRSLSAQFQIRALTYLLMQAFLTLLHSPHFSHPTASENKEWRSEC
jgi:hypothetical protein